MKAPARQSRRLLLALLAGAVLSGLVLTGSVVPAAAADGTLSGTVTEAGTGTPLAGVTVEAFCWVVSGRDAGESCGTTQTRPDGTYSLSLAAGSYKVSYDDVPAHARQFYGGGTDLGDDASTAVAVPSGGSVDGIDVALLPLRTVSGTVTAEAEGTALGDINVTAYQLGSGPAPGWEPAGDAVTGPDGTYALHLADGTYRVGFADAHGPYRTTFYDGAASVAEADDVVVGADVTGIDAALARNNPVTGTVTLDGVDMPAVVVTAYRSTAPGSWDAVKVTETGADGRYALYLPDGTYRVEFKTWQARFATVYYPSASTIEQGADVVVAGAAVPGIDAVIVSDPDSGPAITGTVTVADGGDAAAGVSVMALRYDPSFGAWTQVRVRPTGPDGTYALFVPEGTYRVAFDDVSHRYQPEYYDDAETLESATDVVVPTAGAPGIDAQLTANSRISGQVTADPVPGLPPGPPPTLVTAWRWDDASLDWVQASETFAGPDGHYDLYAPVGAYRIQFTDFSGYYQRPLYYDGVDNIGEATDVVLDGTDVGGIDAHLVPADDSPVPTWPPPQTLSDAGHDSWGPQVAVSRRGTAFAVWAQRGAAGGRIQLSTRQKGHPWAQPTYLSAPGQDAFDPRIAADAEGNLVVAWRRWDGSSYRIEVRTRSAAAGWSSPATLSPAGEDAWDVQAAAGHRRAAVVWRGAAPEGSSQVQVSVRGAGGHWTPATLSGDQAWDPQVALATDGSGAVVWSRAGAAHLRVQAVRLSPQGTWGRRRYLSPRGRDAEDPQVAVAPRGAATVVWRVSGSADERVQAVRREAGRRWSDPRSLSAPGRDAHDPQVAMDAAGAATVVWARWDGSSDRVQASTRAPGRRWSAPETLSASGEQASDPHVVMGPDAGSTAVWLEGGASAATVRSAIRFPGWTWSRAAVLTAPPQGDPVLARSPRIAVGADGSVAAVWERRIAADDRVEGVVRFDPGGPEHCRNAFDVDVNIVLGVPEPLLDFTCAEADAGARWRPVTIWIVNTAFEAVPPGFVPAGATPLEDLVAKLASVRVVVDRGTPEEQVVHFSPAKVLRTDLAFSDYDPSGPPLPMAVSLPRMPGLPRGEHTVTVVWRLTGQHCDGVAADVAADCLGPGRVPMWTRVLEVRGGR